jgi:hypothetical protein
VLKCPVSYTCFFAPLCTFSDLWPNKYSSPVISHQGIQNKGMKNFLTDNNYPFLGIINPMGIIAAIFYKKSFLYFEFEFFSNISLKHRYL